MRKHKGFTYEWYDYDALMTYAAIDNYVTSAILAAMWPALNERRDYTFFKRGQATVVKTPSVRNEQLEVKKLALDFVCDMEVAGMAYDIPANRRMHQAMLEDLAKTEDQIFTAIGKRIDLNSGAALGDFLYRERGFDVPLQTKSGGDSTSGDALKALHKIHEHDWLKDIIKRNDVHAMHGNFIKTYVEDWVKSDGRIHPQYNLFGTSSHRISSSEPNLLNLPRGYYGYNIRELYITVPPMAFLTFDFSSCEVKILAALCKDEAMMDACAKGWDFHSFTGSMIAGLPYEEFVAIVKDEDHPEHKKYKGIRQDAKATTFGLLYGSTVNGIAMNLGKSLEETQKIVDTYFRLFPKVKDFIEDCHKMALANQFVFSPFGQRKMEYGAQDVFRGTAVYNAALRNSQNVSIQGPASTLGLIVFAQMNEELKKIGGRAICTVYDSIEIEVPMNRMAEAIELGFYMMDDWPVANFDWLDFKIGADAEIGWDWGNVHGVKRGITQEKCEEILAAANEEKYVTSRLVLAAA